MLLRPHVVTTRDPYKYFRVEAKELLAELDRGLLVLDKGEGDPSLCQKLLRIAHTLKGAARVVKQTAIADMSHAFEEAIAPYREGPLLPPSELLQQLALQVRLAIERVERLGKSDDAVTGPSSESEIPASVDDRFETVRVGIGDFDNLLEMFSVISRRLVAMRKEVLRSRQAIRMLSSVAEQLGHRLPSSEGFSSSALLGRMARTRGLLDESRSMMESSQRALEIGLEQSESEMRDFSEHANALRLIPASSIFDMLRRVAHDASQQLGREIDFVASGGEHRLDAHVLGPLSEALQHVVRNAVDHGIETASTRQAMGKYARGRIEVRVERKGSRLNFVCRDDGGGIDLALIRRAAVERGTLSPDEAGALDMSNALRLLLTGKGLSSRREVTQISGRGIGLDVVREIATRLNGRVAASSEQGKYTQVELSVPPVLLSQSVLQVEIGVGVAYLPLETVRKTRRINAEEIVRSPGSEQVLDEGAALPYCELAVLLRADAKPSSERYRTLVILESLLGPIAIGVDRLLGRMEVVVRPLPGFLGSVPLVAGAAVDAEGVPQLLLDTAGIAERIYGGLARPAVRSMPGDSPRVLVVDDSLTTRMLEQNILEAAGYCVDLAVSGEDGLEKARQQRYALFVVDVEMPGIDGFEFIRQLRQDPLLRDIPAILVTSLATEESRRRGAEVGADDYIVKGEFEQSVFMETVQRLAV